MSQSPYDWLALPHCAARKGLSKEASQGFTTHHSLRSLVPETQL